MRTMLVLGLALVSVLVAAAVALAGGGYGGQTGATATSTDSYRATLTPKQELPAPKAPAAAAGVFTAKVTEQGARATIRWTLTEVLERRGAYVNVHTGKNPGGEIRGQLRLVG